MKMKEEEKQEEGYEQKMPSSENENASKTTAALRKLPR